jgi:hypothetical protein
MMLGAILVAMVLASAASIALLFLSAPLWVVLLAYPVTGSVVLVSTLAIHDSRSQRWLQGNKSTLLSRVTARFRAGQPPR